MDTLRRTFAFLTPPASGTPKMNTRISPKGIRDSLTSPVTSLARTGAETARTATRATKNIMNQIQSPSSSPMKNMVEETATNWWILENKGTILKIFIIILLLSFLGYNVFLYLARTTESVGRFARNVLGMTLDVTDTTIGLSAKGTKKGVDVVARAFESGIKKIEKIVDPDISKERRKPKSTSKKSSEAGIPEADDTTGNIQQQKKQGYCYIGAEGRNRACVRVGINDHCMSGDIFPTLDVCINPKLRP